MLATVLFGYRPRILYYEHARQNMPTVAIVALLLSMKRNAFQLDLGLFFHKRHSKPGDKPLTRGDIDTFGRLLLLLG